MPRLPCSLASRFATSPRLSEDVFRRIMEMVEGRFSFLPSKTLKYYKDSKLSTNPRTLVIYCELKDQRIFFYHRYDVNLEIKAIISSLIGLKYEKNLNF